MDRQTVFPLGNKCHSRSGHKRLQHQLIRQQKGHKKSVKSVCSNKVERLDMLEEDTFREWTVRNEDRINSQREV